MFIQIGIEMASPQFCLFIPMYRDKRWFFGKISLVKNLAQQKRLGPTQEKICTMHRMPTANRLLASQTKYDNRINHDVPISQPRHGQNLALPP